MWKRDHPDAKASSVIYHFGLDFGRREARFAELGTFSFLVQGGWGGDGHLPPWLPGLASNWTPVGQTERTPGQGLALVCGKKICVP